MTLLAFLDRATIIRTCILFVGGQTNPDQNISFIT